MTVIHGIVAASIALSVPSLAAAQDNAFNTREAWRLLFGTRGSVAALAPDVTWSASDRDIIERLGPTQKYYGAIAFSPDEGLISEATVAAANHHTVGVARGLALAECNEKRAQGTSACKIAADIMPQRYKAGRALQMSIDATFGFGSEFRRAGKPKAFALSAATGLWGFGPSDAAAIAACNAQDCKVVVRD